MAARLAQPDPWSAYFDTAVTITKAARKKLGLD
jgi:hypothetical protein